jgi:hypothetical protein
MLFHSQHNFIKFKSVVTNLITRLNNVLPYVFSQEHCDFIYFDPSLAFSMSFTVMKMTTFQNVAVIKSDDGGSKQI